MKKKINATIEVRYCDVCGTRDGSSGWYTYTDKDGIEVHICHLRHRPWSDNKISYCKDIHEALTHLKLIAVPKDRFKRD